MYVDNATDRIYGKASYYPPQNYEKSLIIIYNKVAISFDFVAKSKVFIQMQQKITAFLRLKIQSDCRHTVRMEGLNMNLEFCCKSWSRISK